MLFCRGLASTLNMDHPTIFKCLNKLKKEKSLNNGQIEQHIMGTRKKQAQRLYKATEKVYDYYKNRTIKDY